MLITTLRQSLLVFGAGLTAGAAVVLIEGGGVATSPLVATVALLVTAMSAFVPLRVALAFAVFLASHQGFLTGFGGAPGRYWKEAFVAILVLRAVRRRVPNSGEVITACFVAAVFLSYALAYDAADVAWGAKILVLFAAGGWAVHRLASGDEWAWVFAALSMAAASNIVVALWQLSVGVPHLLDLGFIYGDSVRHASGELRAFGAFNYGAPYAYTMAVAALGWASLVFARERRAALVTSWVPACAVAGIALSLSRIALVGVAVAVFAGLLRHRASPGILAAAAGAAIAVAAASGPAVRAFISEGFTLQADSLVARLEIWRGRLAEVSTFGQGPASAGAAFERAGETVPGEGSGVVDNLYLSWAYQYGVIVGVAVITVWAVALMSTYVRHGRGDASAVHAGLVSVFALVAAFAVNFWEEFPLNFLVATLVGLAFARHRAMYDRPASQSTGEALCPSPALIGAPR